MTLGTHAKGHRTPGSPRRARRGLRTKGSEERLGFCYSLFLFWFVLLPHQDYFPPSNFGKQIPNHTSLPIICCGQENSPVLGDERERPTTAERGLLDGGGAQNALAGTLGSSVSHPDSGKRPPAGRGGRQTLRLQYPFQPRAWFNWEEKQRAKEKLLCWVLWP